MAFIYLIAGEITIDDREVSRISIISFEKTGNKVNSGNISSHFIFASGTPHNEPIVYGGPFVMTTNEQMTATKERLPRGEMGVLKPL